MPPFTVYILYYRLSNTNKVVQERETAAMNTTAKKQITVVVAPNATAFQREANRALKHINRPRLIFDRNRPYLLYIVYNEEDRTE